MVEQGTMTAEMIRKAISEGRVSFCAKRRPNAGSDLTPEKARLILENNIGRFEGGISNGPHRLDLDELFQPVVAL